MGRYGCKQVIDITLSQPIVGFSHHRETIMKEGTPQGQQLKAE